MRKVLSLLLCVAMLCSMVVVTAYADDPAAMQVADATAVAGGTVTLDINVANNPGIAALTLYILDNDDLGATFAGADYDGDTLGLTPNDSEGIYFWVSPTNCSNALIGTISITIPNDAKAGDYTFTAKPGEGTEQACNEVGGLIDIDPITFTITVADKVITGVNVSIDSDLSVGVHVQAADIDGVSITAVDVDGLEFKTVTDYEEDEESGDYVFYLNVNPWAMDVDFKVDFTDAFTFAEDNLDISAIPTTAKTIGILSYCNTLLAGSPSDTLTQLIADLLEFGRQAQGYKGIAVMDLPSDLTPTTSVYDPEAFGADCLEELDPVTLTGGGASAKFAFDKATIKFGSRFTTEFTFTSNGSVGWAQASVAVAGTRTGLTYDGVGNYTYSYSFAPQQYEGLDFILYSSLTSTKSSATCWTNASYGPLRYATYLYAVHLAEGNEDAEDIYTGADPDGAKALLVLLQAFCNYGASVKAYVAE